ncbi:O-antigen polysaccharide polymerase Wzy [Vibrio owensii]|uniref:O-antigen polysaccharide polymerase Wzy n=1 Tax=Vibrio owensii TaxID=696485 RepID=UPI0009B7FA98|nr:O-antigen polysaccharide polymerase Wzy [Vibrio owensii]
MLLSDSTKKASMTSMSIFMLCMYIASYFTLLSFGYYSDLLYFIFIVLSFLLNAMLTYKGNMKLGFGFLLVSMTYLFQLARPVSIYLVDYDVIPTYFGFIVEGDIGRQLYSASLLEILILISAFSLAYYLCNVNRKCDLIDYKAPHLVRKDSYFFVMMAFALIYISVFAINMHSLFSYVSVEGYLGLYKYFTQMAQSPTFSYKLYNYMSLLTYSLFAYNYVYNGNKFINKIFIFILLIKGLVFLFLGQRGGLFALIVFFIYLYSEHKGVKFTKVILIALSLVLLSQIIFFVRLDMSFSDISLISSIGNFLYNQGTSFYVYAISKEIDLPLSSILNSTIPFIKVVYSIFSPGIPTYEFYPGHFLTRSWSQEAYDAGMGFGWTIFSDVYHIFRGNLILMIAGFFGFGWLINEIEYSKRRSIRYIFLSIAPALLFLPRAGLTTIVPLIVVSIFMLYFFRLILVERLVDEKNS